MREEDDGGGRRSRMREGDEEGGGFGFVLFKVWMSAAQSRDCSLAVGRLLSSSRMSAA